MKPKENRRSISVRLAHAKAGTHASGVQHARGVRTPSTKRHANLYRTRVGVDTGGTFTDFVFEAEGELRIFKLASTPDDPSRAIIEGLGRIAAATGSHLSEIEVVHGTTVGTNALLQRRGARTALVTTAGFE